MSILLADSHPIPLHAIAVMIALYGFALILTGFFTLMPGPGDAPNRIWLASILIALVRNLKLPSCISVQKRYKQCAYFLRFVFH